MFERISLSKVLRMNPWSTVPLQLVTSRYVVKVSKSVQHIAQTDPLEHGDCVFEWEQSELLQYLLSEQLVVHA